MSFRPFRLMALIVALWPTWGMALDLEALSDAERSALRAEIRAYLLDNPEVLMEAIGVLETREAEAQADAELVTIAALAADLFQSPYDWVGGNPQGDVTLVEFLDYRCGFCKRAFPEIEALLADDGNIRFIVKEFPILGEASVLASRFAIATRLALGDAAYKAVHDGLMTLRGDVTPESLQALAQDLSLDHAAIMARMDDPQIQATIESNYALAQALAISGTPTFVLETGLLRGALPRADIEAAIAATRAAN